MMSSNKKQSTINRLVRNNKNSHKQMRKDLNGSEIRVPTNPPPVLLQPFYPYTISKEFTIGSTGTYQLFTSDVLSWCGDGLGIATNQLRIKVQSIKLWNTGNLSKALSVEYREMVPDAGSTSNPGNSVLYSKTDYGSPLTFAAQGYRWGISFSSVVRSSVDPQTTVVTVRAVAGSVILTRIHVMWSIRGSS